MIAEFRETAARDPLGLLVAFLLAVAAGVGAMILTPHLSALFQLVPHPEHHEDAPAPKGPAKWISAAKPGDILTVPDHVVAYWGDPNAEYGRRATRQKRRPAGIVVHFPVSHRLMPSVFYGHRRDRSRGNASYGYHFYIGRQGQIVQGAPLSRRTNHVRDAGSSRRRPGVASGHDSRDLIGITTVGACVRQGPMCVTENLTEAQRSAALAVVRALQSQYNLPCDAIWGHGELQRDRTLFEGKTIATEVRSRCRDLPMALGKGQ